MSSRAWPASGYVIEAKKLLTLLPEAFRESYRTLLGKRRTGITLLADENEDHDWDAITEFLDDHLPSQLPRPESIFQLTDEDFGGAELERGVLYAVFTDDDLYERALRPGAEEMNALLGELPEFHSWTVFG